MLKTSERKKIHMWLLVVLVCSLLASCSDNNLTATPTTSSRSLPATSPGVLAPQYTPDTSNPLIAARIAKVQAALQQPVPILLLDAASLDENQRTAQDIAVQNPDFKRYAFAPNTTTPVRTEIFGIYPARPSDLTAASSSCKTSTCYRVELYNYAYNLTLIGVVDIKAKAVLTTSSIPGSQPDIPDHLKNIALEIATKAPQVKLALGASPTADQALMASTKTSLNKTKCERSLHLCVAPTFVEGTEALWTIVDLTDLTLVGVKWTKVGESSRSPITEKNLQDGVITQQFCEKNTALKRNGWQMDYILTSSDGLRVSEVSFNNKLVLRDAKVVDWHVNYSQRDGFGYSDAIGCPVFSQAAVVAVGSPQVAPMSANNQETGFSLIQDFWSIGWPAPCNYYYQQRFEFYNDGRFRVVAGSVGRGCGNDGTYRPVTRIAFAGDKNSFSEWAGSDWTDWTSEKWQLQTPQTAFTPEGYQYRLQDNNKQGYYLEPGRGQFDDGGRGDNSYVYLTRYHNDIDEGESDLVTIGPCCNGDYRQGPEKFIEPTPEKFSSVGDGLVVWYVAQLKNDDTPGKEYCWAQSKVDNGLVKVNRYPCFSGPMFVPTK